jgi:hypothetical protein
LLPSPNLLKRVAFQVRPSVFETAKSPSLRGIIEIQLPDY